MISATQLDELRQVHKNHVANTFLFASKLLDQRRRISDAQVEVIHGLLHDLAGSSDGEAGRDPAAMAQQAMQKISQSIARQSGRSGELMRETAAAYAEILRLTMAYGSDTFAGLQTAGRDAAQLGTPPAPLANPWMDSFLHSFEDATNFMSTGLKPMMAMAEPTAGTTGNRKPAANGRAGK